RAGSVVGHSAGAEFQAHWETTLCDVAAASSLRTQRLEGKHGHRALLDPLHRFCPTWAGHAQTAMKQFLSKLVRERASVRSACGHAAACPSGGTRCRASIGRTSKSLAASHPGNPR